MKPTVVVAAVALVQMVTAASSFAAFEAGDFYPTITGGFLHGNGRNDDVQVAAARFGLVHYFRERLGFFSEAAALAPSGRRDGRVVDTVGLGFASGLRWHFRLRPRYGLYAEWGAGFMVATDAFPPQGTSWNGMSYFGAGVNAGAGDGLQILAGLRQMHVSNGKGLVPQNPSFDGLGGYLGLALTPRYRPPYPLVGDALPFGGRDLRWRAEATYEHVDDDDSSGGGVSADLALAWRPGLRLQLAGTMAQLVDEAIWKVSARLYQETTSGRVLVGYSRQEFNVFTSDICDLQVERTLSDVSTVVGTVSYEDKNLAQDRLYGGLFIITYPAAFAAISSGVGFERQQREIFDSVDNLNDAGLNLGLEVAPRFMARLGLSAYCTVGIGYDSQLAGIRLQPGRTASLGERHRRGAVMMVR